MKRKVCLILFAVCFITLCGCDKETIKMSENEFVNYNISFSTVKTEYKIYDFTEQITVYFPVVTNKEITKTELGGVAAKLPPTKADIKVTLRAMSQDNLNVPYQDKYISFLKYRFNIENADLLQVNDIINLCDTTLWIYHNSEFQKIQIDEDYLQIELIENEKEPILPDWNKIIANMKTDIEFELKHS